MKASRLQRAILTVNNGQFPSVAESHISDIDPRALIAVTLIYLIAILSIPLGMPDRLIWLAVYPIITAPLSHIAYERIFIRSLYVLPFILAIGIFNPFIDREAAFTFAGITVSRGCLTFLSIILRGLLSVQALLLLIHIAGFNRICDGLRSFHVPEILVTQLLMAYRYMGVLLSEALTMTRAREARGYGRNAYPPSMWAPFVGQLLLRSLERSRRIHSAMLARGFHGSLATTARSRWNVADTLYCLIWIVAIAAIRFIDLSSIFDKS